MSDRGIYVAHFGKNVCLKLSKKQVFCLPFLKSGWYILSWKHIFRCFSRLNMEDIYTQVIIIDKVYSNNCGPIHLYIDLLSWNRVNYCYFKM